MEGLHPKRANERREKDPATPWHMLETDTDTDLWVAPGGKWARHAKGTDDTHGELWAITPTRRLRRYNEKVWGTPRDANMNKNWVRTISWTEKREGHCDAEREAMERAEKNDETNEWNVCTANHVPRAT